MNVDTPTIIMFIFLAIFGGSIGIARYSIEDGTVENHNFYRFLAHFILNAATAVVGGILTKFLLSNSAEAILAGGIASPLIGYLQVRKLLFDAITKRFQNGKTIPIEKKKE